MEKIYKIERKNHQPFHHHNPTWLHQVKHQNYSFARTIAANKPHPRARRQRGGRTIKNYCAAEAHGYITEIKHRQPLAELWS